MVFLWLQVHKIYVAINSGILSGNIYFRSTPDDTAYNYGSCMVVLWYILAF